MEEVLIKKIKDLERKREEAKKMKKKLTNDIQVLMKKNIEYAFYIILSMAFISPNLPYS